jgi:hypothetical protein
MKIIFIYTLIWGPSSRKRPYENISNYFKLFHGTFLNFIHVNEKWSFIHDGANNDVGNDISNDVRELLRDFNQKEYKAQGLTIQL